MISTKIKKFDFVMLFFNFFLVLSLQATDISFGGLKIGEIFMLASLPLIVYFRNKVPKITIQIIFFLLVILVITFLKNLYTEFYYPKIEMSILKSSYYISIARLIELLSCITLILYINLLYIQYKVYGFDFRKFIKNFFFINVIFSFVFIFLYLLASLHLIESSVVYGESNRLRGYFVEGGPLGLYYAFLIAIGFFLRIKRWYLLVFIVILLLSDSKAGYLFLIFISSIYFFYFRLHNRVLKFFGFGLVSIILVYALYQIADNYYYAVSNVELLISQHANDGNFVMGRIAGVFIGTEMFLQNPFFGIGLGNYSIVRNDPLYLNFFPPVEGWDLTGLGIFTLLIETGIIGFFIFTVIFYKLLIKLDNQTYKMLIISFYIVFFFGVQVYFLYPWIAIGFALIFIQESKNVSFSN